MERKERPIDRIVSLIEWLIAHGVIKSVAQFESLCGLSSRYIRNLSATKKGNPGVDIVAAIYGVFPAVSLKWLITGNGRMFTQRDEEAMLAAMRLDVVSHDVLSATNDNNNLRETLKRTLLDHKDDLSAEEKVALLEKLL